MSSNGKFKSLLRSSFKRKDKTPYQSWEDEDSVLDYEIHDPPTHVLDTESPKTKGLVECFYLGSFDMSGLPVRGRGCIDTPGAAIWTQSQEDDGKPKRKNSLKQSRVDIHLPINSLLSVCKPPKFVRLTAASDDLEVYDNSTDELTSQFAFSKISFVGTHPKHSKMFVFIGVPKDSQTPFCHAFKCASKEKANYTAETLSDIFCRKIRALQASKQTTTTVH